MRFLLLHRNRSNIHASNCSEAHIAAVVSHYLTQRLAVVSAPKPLISSPSFTSNPPPQEVETEIFARPAYAVVLREVKNRT